MAKSILFIALYFFSFIANSATIVPIAIERQLQDASAVIHGTVIKQNSVYRFNQVFTEVTFKVERSAGLSYMDIRVNNSFALLYPGGTWQGVVYDVSGTPRFTIGENVVVLVTKSEVGYVPTNSGLAKYNLYRKGGEVFLGSSYASQNPKLNAIPMQHFEEVVKNSIGQRLADNHSDKTGSSKAKIVAEAKEKQRKDGREIASISEDLDENKPSESTIIWPVILFALLGAYSVMSSWKKG